MKIGQFTRKVGRYAKGIVTGVPIGILCGARLAAMQASYVPTRVRDESESIYYNCERRPNAFLRKVGSYAVCPALYTLCGIGFPFLAVANTADIIGDSVKGIARHGIDRTVKDNIDNIKLMESFLKSDHEEMQIDIRYYKNRCKL